MTNSETFKAAHKLAKTFEGDYRACFALALRTILNGSVEEFDMVGYANVLGEEEFESLASGDEWYSFTAKVWKEKRLYLNAKYGRRNKWTRDASGYIDLSTMTYHESGRNANASERATVEGIALSIIEKSK